MVRCNSVTWLGIGLIFDHIQSSAGVADSCMANLADSTNEACMYLSACTANCPTVLVNDIRLVKTFSLITLQPRRVRFDRNCQKTQTESDMADGFRFFHSCLPT